MAYVITQSCCSDASCVRVCPVNCIHPAPGEPDFGHTDMLYVDGGVCIDCGACADACPVEAVKPKERLSAPESIFATLNDQYYADRETRSVWGDPDFPATATVTTRGLRVAVVGTGPAASYAAEELLHRTDAEVTMLDRRADPGGLVRRGVAPDHVSTRRVAERFAGLRNNPRLQLLTGVDVGRDVTREEVLDHHHAVIYATGAPVGRRLGVTGEELAGSLTAADAVRWYNEEPAPSAGSPVPDLSGGHRAVVVGTGNVALDVARLLAMDPDDLESSEISAGALAALRASRLREVVLLGRRGPGTASWTTPELAGLLARDDLEVVLAGDPETLAEIRSARADSKAALLRELPVIAPEELGNEPMPLVPAGNRRRRVVLAFHACVGELTGDGRLCGLRLRHGDQEVDVPAGVVVAAVGYRGRPVPGLPFDEERGTVPHVAGGVPDGDGRPVVGTYVTGWAKRGPSGGIGANRRCAAETVDTLLADLAAVPAALPRGAARRFARLARTRAG